MYDLLKVEVNENNEQVISGRMLHEFLEIETRYNDWFNRMKEYGFVEDIDFYSRLSKTSNGGRPSTDHILKINMAKELCMLARNEKGKQARQYFIAVEKEWNSPLKVMARGLKIADEQLRLKDVEISRLNTENQIQAQQIAELKPIKEYVDIILQSKGTVTITQIAADYGMSAQKLNKILNQERIQYKVNDQWILYSNMMNKGYTKSETMKIAHDDGRQEVKMYTRWTQKGRIKIHDILTKLGFIANYDREQQRLIS